MTVIGEVMAERSRQDEKWGGPQVDDARKTELDWIEDLWAYLTWARQMHRMGSQVKYRRRMMQVAALAVAACESHDRKVANIPCPSPECPRCYGTKTVTPGPDALRSACPKCSGGNEKEYQDNLEIFMRWERREEY